MGLQTRANQKVDGDRHKIYLLECLEQQSIKKWLFIAQTSNIIHRPLNLNIKSSLANHHQHSITKLEALICSIEFKIQLEPQLQLLQN